MRTEALDFPKSILIETINKCQGECKFCPYETIRKDEYLTLLTREKFKQLIDEKQEPIAFWCDYGQPYNKTEKKAVENICDELVVPDKSLRMYDEFEKYFEVKLYSPFVKMTKTEVLCVWKDKWDKYLDANETVSCYDNEGNCQNCSSCAKREVAFVASGYNNYYPEVFTNQHELIEGHWFSRVDIFQYERRTDMLIALKKYIDNLTPKLQELVNYNYAKYEEEINRRIIELNNYKTK